MGKKDNQTDLKPFSIVFTYGLAGQLVPCGCSTNQLGGLPQRAFLFIKKSLSDHSYLDGQSTNRSLPPLDRLLVQSFRHKQPIVCDNDESFRYQPLGRS